MSADQRKAVLVPIDVVNGNLPAVWVVAEFALCSILAAMKISVAILTLVRDVAEIKISVAIHALHYRVTPTQREPGLRMFEFEFGPDWLPALSAVTLLTWNLEFVPVRTPNRSVRLNPLT